MLSLRIGSCVGGLLSLVVLAGCLDPTEMRLMLRTDVSGVSSVETAIHVGPADDPSALHNVTVTDQWSPSSGVIGSLTLVPSGAEDAAVALEIVSSLDHAVQSCEALELPDHCIVARRSLYFLPQKSLPLPIVMRGSCAGVTCPPDQTCVDGACTSAGIDPNTCGTPAGCGEETLPPPEQPPVVSDWVQVLGGSGEVSGTRLALDEQSNLIVLGEFTEQLDIDGTSWSDQSADGADLFVASFGPDGALDWLWQLAASDAANIQATAVTVDDQGAVYATGQFSGTLMTSAGAHQSDGAHDTFVVKLDSSGQQQWLVAHGGSGTMWFSGFAHWGSELLTAGPFNGIVLFHGGGQEQSTNASSNLLVGRFSADDGSRLSSVAFPGSGQVLGATGAVDGGGLVHAFGAYTGALDIPPLPASETFRDLFHAVVDPKDEEPNAAVRDAWQVGGPSPEGATDIAISPQGDACIIGTFNSLVNVRDQSVEGGSGASILAACMPPSGSARWALGYGNAQDQAPRALDVDAEGLLYLVSDLRGTVLFDGVPHGGADLTPVLTVLRSSDGGLEWSHEFPTDALLQIRDTVGHGDGAFLTGRFGAPMDFGDGERTPTGPWNGFVMRLPRPGP